MASPFGKLQAASAVAGLLDGVLTFQQNRRAEGQANAARQDQLRMLKAKADQDAQARAQSQANADRTFNLSRQRFDEQVRGNEAREAREQSGLDFRLGQPGPLEQIQARGEQSRLLKQTPGAPGAGKVPDPFVEDTKRRSNMSRAAKSMRDLGQVAGFSVTELDGRHPGLIEDALEDASQSDNTLTTDEAIKNGVAFDWAKSLTDPDDAVFNDDMGNDLLQLGVGSTTPVASGAFINGLLGDGTFDDDQEVDLEDIARQFVDEGRSEQEYADFVFKLVVEPNLAKLDKGGKLGALGGAVKQASPFLGAVVRGFPIGAAGQAIFNKIQDRREQQ